MRRREFIAGLGGAAAWPMVARGQKAERIRRIGVLGSLAEDDPEMKPRLAAFRRVLESLGWSEGRDVRIDYRFAPGGAGQEQARAEEMVALRPDVIVATNTPATAALQRASSEVPIVFVNVSDPLGSGFIASLARPGGNLTGFMLFEASVAERWLAMLKEIAPALTRAALLANPKTTPYEYFQRAAEAAARSLGVSVVPSPIEIAADIERSIESFARAPNGGLLVPPDTTTLFHRDLRTNTPRPTMATTAWPSTEIVPSLIKSASRSSVTNRNIGNITLFQLIDDCPNCSVIERDLVSRAFLE
jgi:putative ABC transport system substrate-binding protein